MTVFFVPDDFPLVSLAVASPLVRKGDVILVKKGVENEVVVVPPDKSGLRIVADRGDGFIPDDEGPAEVVEDDQGDGLEENDGADLSGNPAEETPSEDDSPDPDQDSVEDSGPAGDPPATGTPWLEDPTREYGGDTTEEDQDLSGSPDDYAQPLEKMEADAGQDLDGGENAGAEIEVGDRIPAGVGPSGNPADEKPSEDDSPDPDHDSVDPPATGTPWLDDPTGEYGGDTAEEDQDLSGSPDDYAQPLEEVEADPVPETGPQPFIIVTKAGAKMVRLGQASGSPYWVVVHRHG